MLLFIDYLDWENRESWQEEVLERKDSLERGPWRYQMKKIC